MTVEIKVPPLGESVVEVKVSRIIVPSGSYVKVDAEILELETDKLNQVIYATTAGVITIKANVGSVLKVGEVLATIEVAQQPQEEVLKKPVLAKEQNSVIKQKETKIRTNHTEWLETTGSDVTKPKQVLHPSIIGSAGIDIRKPLSNMRKVIAERLLEAKRSTAMLTTFNEVDMTAVTQLRERYKESFPKKYGVKLGFMSFFVKASVSALETFPIVNAYIDGDDLVYRGGIDISIAVSTEKGLLVPVVKNCDQLEFYEIEKKIEEYALKAREGSISLDELRGGGFTITNGGIFGSLLSTPIINPPQCAILGMHKIQKRPVVVDEQIVIRPMMYLALSYDHRILDGKDAVSFLVHIKNCLEDPDRLLIGM